MDVQPFEIHIQEEVLEDLRERLARTRWPDEIAGSGWDYGSNLAYVKELAEYWCTQFDWRAQEEVINTYRHFRTTVDGLGIHFIHERGKGPNPLPLIISHGWPSTFFEILKVIPLLTDPASHGGDPADSFDVVVPSLPGYGFSDLTTQRGMDFRRIADLWVELMDGLGYGRFVAHGSDWGTLVTSWLGYTYHPDRVIGIHATGAGGARPYLGPGSRELSERERVYLEEQEKWRQAEQGYFHIQQTKPQTLCYGLNDSPAGLAGWIVEKFRTWSDCDGDVEQRFTKDELLTNLTIYWATQTINSATRLYYESRNSFSSWYLAQGERVQAPSAVARFPKDQVQVPREWSERSHNIQHWTEMPRGGHFPAMEEPELLVEDMRAFFRGLRG